MARVKCPKCRARLNLDDEDLGLEVECGACGNLFVAEAEESQHRRDDDDDDDEGDEDREALRRRLRRERREERDYARSLVRPPAIALLVSIAIGLVWRAADMVYMLVTGGPLGPVGADDPSVTLGAIIGAVTTFLLSPLIIVACIRMMNLRGHGLAMTACVLSLTPCAGCFLLGFPIGVWGLIVLNRSDVRDAFR